MVSPVTPCHVAPPLLPENGFTHCGAYTDGIRMRPVAGSQLPSKPPAVVCAATPLAPPPPPPPLAAALPPLRSAAGTAPAEASPALVTGPPAAPDVPFVSLPGGVTCASTLLPPDALAAAGPESCLPGSAIAISAIAATTRRKGWYRASPCLTSPRVMSSRLLILVLLVFRNG